MLDSISESENRLIVLRHKFESQLKSLKNKKCNWVSMENGYAITGCDLQTIEIDHLVILGIKYEITNVIKIDWISENINALINSFPNEDDWWKYKNDNYDRIYLTFPDKNICVDNLKQAVFPLMSYILWRINNQSAA
jgi:hypothetical protein